MSKNKQHPHKASSERSINSGHRKRHHPQSKHSRQQQNKQTNTLLSEEWERKQKSSYKQNKIFSDR